MRSLVALAFVLVIGACPGGEPPPQTCSKNTDCPGTQLCLSGTCGDPTSIACKADSDCPTDFICLENGRCRANAQCQVDADCCPDASSCTSTCTDFQCIGTACTAGDAEDCFVGCHRGQRTCENGNWSLCDAAPVTDAEVCGDDVDNDCNGQKNEGCAECTAPATRDCDTPCGPGTQECQSDGTFGACDTVDGCICTPGTDVARTVSCGACGFKDSSCGADGFWADDPVCQGEGACTPGEVDTVDCGSCGQQTRTCGDDCTFGAFGACSVPLDACLPGETVLQGCGACGIQQATCGDNCTFGSFTTCDEGNGCSQGDVQTQACGKCGTKTATCDGNCQFGAFGACQDEGVCTPGEVETQACGNCGTQSRICGSDCTFGLFGQCEGEGECAPSTSVDEACGPTSTDGICQQGTRTKTCDANCRFEPAGNCDGAVFASQEICGNGVDENCDGFDDSLPDQFEANDTCAAAVVVRNADGTDDPNGVVLQPTFDSVDLDQDDYFFLNGIDNTSFATEHVHATITGIPAGMDVDLYLYKGFTACNSDDPIGSTALSKSENVGNADEVVDFAEGFGGDDGQYYIRAHRYDGNNCFQPYTLTVTGLR